MLDAVRHVLAAIRTPVDPDRLDQVDSELLDALTGPVEAFARAWYHLRADGMANIVDGPALVVGNHDSGMTFLEAIGWGARVHRERPHERWFGLAHDGIVGLPGLGPLLVRLGAVRARPDIAAAALAAGHKVVVFPGGNLEAFRPFSRRYQIDLGGRTGWAKLALRSGVPVQPVVFCGGHRGFIVLRDNRDLARLLRVHRWLRVDTWPLILALPWGLWLGPNFHLPLPVPVKVRVLPAVPVDGLDPGDPASVEILSRRVVDAMQRGMDALVAEGTRGRSGVLRWSG